MKKILIAGAMALLVAGNSYAGKKEEFKARLEGFDLTGAPVATAARGKAKLKVIDDGSALEFRVDVEDFDNLLMAHIHVADGPVLLTDPSGPPVYWFNGGTAPGQTMSENIHGRLAEGYLYTSGQLNSPRPDITTIEQLIDAIRAGRASIIVHSSDFPRGELRGTLE